MRNSQATSISRAAYIQSTDPASDFPERMIAKVLWVDTTSSPYTWKVRNSTNDGWDTLTFSATPGGAAGGDLSGTYPNPTVAKINGVAYNGDPLTQYIKVDGTRAFTGDQSMGSHKLTSVTDPSSAQDAATKAYVDSAIASNRDFKDSVRVATTTAGTLATDFENGDTIDGVVLATSDRILIKDQADGTENGIYVVAASGAPTRATDADTSAEVTSGLIVPVEAGTANADKLFMLTTNAPITLGATSLTFSAYGTSGSPTGAAGGVLDGTYPNPGLAASVAGDGLTETSDVLSVNVDGSTLEINTDTLRVKDAGITVAKLANAAKTFPVEFVIDGGGSAITTGVKGDIYGKFGTNATIVEATLLADQSGSIVVDIFKCTYAQYDAGSTHPVSGDKITASAPPTISSATKSTDTTLTGWTTTITDGDVLRVNVNSATTVTRVTLSLILRRS